jgi:hypothetical protein
MCLLGFTCCLAHGQSKSLEERLQELEAKLKSLEEAQKPKAASETAASAQTVELQELRRQLDVIAAEMERMRSGEADVEVTPQQAASLGLGPSAASVYRKKQGVSIAGYGEMLYLNPARKNEAGVVRNGTTQLDFLRAIIYAGYRFNDKFLFNSEIEFEHANTAKGGEASVEFAYLDYMANPHLTVRGGLLLVPMGLTNEYHEPTAFIGARRTETESRIIPSTWRENGFGVLGSAGVFNYRAYLINGMDAAGFTSDGIRGGRQSGARAKASDMAFVGRLDIAPTPGLFFGGSLYTGGSGQGQFVDQGKNLRVRTTIGEVHGQLQARGLDLRGLYARAAIDDVAALNRLRNLTGAASIGETLHGGYVQLGYNLLSRHSEQMRLTPYYRFEKLNTQDEVPEGFVLDPARRQRFHTAGLEFRPIQNIVVKGDYQWVRNRATTGVNQFNLGLGYNF